MDESRRAQREASPVGDDRHRDRSDLPLAFEAGAATSHHALPVSARRIAGRAFAAEPAAPRPALRWPLLPLPDADGRLHWPEPATCVADGLRIVLATRPGEQLQHPAFGVGLENALQQPNTVALRADILRRVSEQLRQHEPRARLETIELLPVDGGRGLQLELRYLVAGLAAPRRLLVAIDAAEAAGSLP